MTKKLPEGVRRLYRPGDKKGKPSGRYQARYPDAHGVLRSAGTFASKVDAKDARAHQMALLRAGTWVDPLGPRTLFETWSARWLELNRGGNSKTQSFLRSRIDPWWGQRRLGDVTPMDVQLWLNSMVTEGLAPHTIHGVFGTFKRIMQDAVDHDLLVKTPCRNISGMPKQKPVKKKIRLTPAQLFDLEARVAPRYRAMIHLAGWAGLRWGECAGLQWDDVDLEKGLLHIQRSARSGTTKNGESRYVVLAPQSVEVLRTHRRDYGSRQWVFTTPVRGVQLGYADFRKAVWVPLVASVDPALTFHALRHFYATSMVANGLDWKVLSEQLGHYAPSFTMDVYGMPRQDAHDVTIAAIEAAMRDE